MSNNGAQHIHNSSHGHGHSHEHDGRPDAFRWSVLLNSGLTGLQLAIGISFGSLALIGDALHNLGDVAGLLLGWGAERLSLLPANRRFTYGLGRSTQLASMINAALILMASAVVVVEGIQRLNRPVEMVAGPVAWAAAIGVVVNLVSARMFGHGYIKDLNRRAAVMHLLTDAAVSVAVLLSAILVKTTGATWLDPLTGIGVGIAVAWTGWSLLRQSVVVALDGVPAGIDLDQVERSLNAIDGVAGVQHLHVWGMSTSKTALTAQLQRSGNPGEDDLLLKTAKAILAELGIAHATLELAPMAALPTDSAGEAG
jgi:cobalt-zinc-cadmium efflux system protein